MPSRPAARPPHQRRIAGRLGRRDQQHPPGLRGQDLRLPPETLLHAAQPRHRTGHPEPAGQLRDRQPSRQLQQRQRVAVRLGHDLIAHPHIQRPGQHRVQQRARVRLPQTSDHKVRQVSQVGAGDTAAEHDAHRLPRQPARHEPEHLRGGPIKPLGVIDHADQRPLVGRLAQQTQDRRTEQEPVRRRPGTQPERGSQGVALRLRKRVQAAQHRGRRTTGAARRTAAPSPTAPRPRRRPCSPRHARPGTPAAPSCPRPPPRAGRAPGSRRRSRRSGARRASRTPPGDPPAHAPENRHPIAPSALGAPRVTTKVPRPTPPCQYP